MNKLNCFKNWESLVGLDISWGYSRSTLVFKLPKSLS